MRKVLLIALLSLTVGGCANQLAKIKQVYDVATTTTVPASYVLAAANSFEVASKAVGAYYDFCATARTDKRCAPDILRTVRSAEIKGRKTRDQLEAYITTGTDAPATLYNILVTAVNTITTSPASTVGGNQ